MMSEQLIDYILMLTREGYQVVFEHCNDFPHAMRIRLQKYNFALVRVFCVDDFKSYVIDKDSVIIFKLSEMKAQFESDMRLRIKMKGENK